MGVEIKGLKEAMESLDGIMDTAVGMTLDALEKASIDTVADARVRGTYTDRTGNLRSSIGFVIKNQGMTVAEEFKPAGNGTGNGEDGVAKAKALADRVSKSYGDQIVAVLVAGENYAVYVESRGYDVISGAMLQFANRFEQNFKAAGGNQTAIRVKKGVGNK